MPDVDVTLRRLVARLKAGPGALDAETRRRALGLERLPDPLQVFAGKLAGSDAVSPEDVVRLREAGLSQDQVIELTACIALGVAQGRLRAGLAALEETAAW
jgi:hypothetical protein